LSHATNFLHIVIDFLQLQKFLNWCHAPAALRLVVSVNAGVCGLADEVPATEPATLSHAIAAGRGR
jgi:hypothetical protein